MKKILSWIFVISVLLTALHIDICAAGNSEENLYEEGMEFFEKEDFDRAFARFQISGEVRGYAPAQNMLGICYRDGLGTEQDLEKAEEYFMLSAAQGYTPAQENVASLSVEDVHEKIAESTPSTDPVSTQVFAEEKEAVIPWAENVKIGDTVKFGSYEQDNDLTNGTEAIEWIILDVQDGKAMLLSKYGLDCQVYHKAKSDVTWENCMLRAWLNSAFFDGAFSDVEKNQILFTDAKTEIKSDTASIPEWSINDLVFIPSLQETNRYLDSTTIKCEPTEYAIAQGAWIAKGNIYTIWWLRSSTLSRINPGGVQDDDRSHSKINEAFTAVRPALWLSLEELPKREQILENTSEREYKAKSVLTWPDELKTGNTIEFGRYEQDGDFINGKEPIEWIVLEVKEDEALLLSTKALECRPFTNESSDQVTWEMCSLRRWLNNNFLMEAFSKQEQERILLSEINAEKNPSFSTDPGKTTNDKIFILSLFESRQYFSSDSERQCCPTVYCGTRSPVTYQNGNCWWWLRTPGSISSFAVAVDMNGTIKIDGMRANNPDHVMVRPALRVSLKSGNT